MARSVFDVLREHSCLCWYPSANADFRGLLYLSDRYYQWKSLPRDPGQALPDLFIMTDVCPSDTASFTSPPPWMQRDGEQGYTEIRLLRTERYRDLRQLYTGFRLNTWTKRRRLVTDIRTDHVERLEDLDLPCNPRLFRTDAPDGGRPDYYGRAFYFRAHVASLQREGSPEPRIYTYDRDVLYILADNTAFARDFLLRNRISAEYVIQIRYGEGFGGSCVKGNWLRELLPALQCKYFMANPRYAGEAWSEELQGFFPAESLGAPAFRQIACLRSYENSLFASPDDFDDIYLYRVL